MPGNKCEFITCQKRQYKHPNLKLYRFPANDRTRMMKWIINSGNARLLDLKPEQLKTRYVCECHFNPESFVNISKHRLVPSAVPLFYENTPSTTTTTTVSRTSNISATPIIRLKSPKYVYGNKKKDLPQILPKKEIEDTTTETEDSDTVRKFLDF